VVSALGLLAFKLTFGSAGSAAPLLWEAAMPQPISPATRVFGQSPRCLVAALAIAAEIVAGEKL
jgi:hypothetical protein